MEYFIRNGFNKDGFHYRLFKVNRDLKCGDYVYIDSHSGKIKKFDFIRNILEESFGELSAIFMSKNEKGTNIVMPEKEINEIIEMTIKRMKKINEIK